MNEEPTEKESAAHSTPPRHLKHTGRRFWLEPTEVDRLRKAAAKLGRYGQRDTTMILIGYRHGLRVSELVAVRWENINLEERTIWVNRLKGSKSGLHTMERDEVTALKKLGPERSGPVFVTERGGKLCPSTFFKLLTRAAEEAKLGVKVHPHMLRHACGYALAAEDIPTRVIQEWLGHMNIQHTVRYTELNPDRFRKAGVWSRRRA